MYNMLLALFFIVAYVQDAWCGGNCTLDSHPSVQYNCLDAACGANLPDGTVVQPACNKPYYYSPFSLPMMKCIDGNWDNNVTCTPECGTVTKGVLVEGGRPEKKGELPWHASIYRKTTNPYLPICEGSIVSTTVVISVATCFSSQQKQLPAENYAVAVGNHYRRWNDERDIYAQFSDVQAIHIAPRYRGRETNYQDDIAIVKVATAFQFNAYVRPVCLSFDVNFEKHLLKSGRIGKVGEVGKRDGAKSEVLKVAEIPYIDIEDCFSHVSPDAREYITSDKICAGYFNSGHKDTFLCRGSSGSGLVFPYSDRGIERYYLRGVLSVGTNFDEDHCSSIGLFTQLLSHEHFIKMYL